jgi:hypothetical protein
MDMCASFCLCKRLHSPALNATRPGNCEMTLSIRNSCALMVRLRLCRAARLLVTELACVHVWQRTPRQWDISSLRRKCTAHTFRARQHAPSDTRSDPAVGDSRKALRVRLGVTPGPTSGSPAFSLSHVRHSAAPLLPCSLGCPVTLRSRRRSGFAAASA